MNKKFLVISLFLLVSHGSFAKSAELNRLRVMHRSPVDVALGRKSGFLATANETSDSVSIISTADYSVLDEYKVGDHPAYVEFTVDERHLFVSCMHAGEIVKLKIVHDRLIEVGRVKVGFEPVGMALSNTSAKLYVGLTANGTVLELDQETLRIERSFEVGHWPRYLTLSRDESRLAVGLSGDSRIAVIDLDAGKRIYTQYMTGAINIGHLYPSKDGKYVYFPWMVYRDNPITPQFIRLGWVLASRVGRARLDGPAYREAISLDVPGKAVADPHGLVMTDNEHRMVVSASGTHELLVYRKPDLPFSGSGGPGDLIDRRLLADSDLFYRIDVGGRPMGMAMAADNKTVYVANYLNNSVQIVDVETRRIVNEISLGDAPQLDPAREGTALFYDGRKSLDQWYSCHSCHYNGGVSSRTMDTWNDGSKLTNKTVLPLYNLINTAPWTWHGWQGDLNDAMRKSFTVTMQGDGVTASQADSVVRFLSELETPANPFRKPDGGLTAAANRGKNVFESDVAGCLQCHKGQYFTDGEIHDVGTGEDDDAYDGYNTPSLVGVYRKVRLLHDGRVKSLEAVLTEDHSPEHVAGTRPLKQDELLDLIEYLKSL
ncbi:MAG: hypothetical protein CMJ76_10580 [Planctomycetaceae bacterium]|nr:hypothetical protein [Planctomycetaceae bacterium]